VNTFKTWQKFFFGLMLFGILLFYFLKKKNNTTSNTATRPTLNELEEILKTASPKNKDYSPLAKYVFAQWQFESANFSSDLYKRAANASGMRVASQRKQAKIGESNKYAVYKDWQQCAEDLVLWFDARNFPTMLSSLDNYVMDCKKRGYFTANEASYLAGVKRYYNENN